METMNSVLLELQWVPMVSAALMELLEKTIKTQTLTAGEIYSQLSSEFGPSFTLKYKLLTLIKTLRDNTYVFYLKKISHTLSF
jgi:hypothetical protein